jgi:hypothetical protein
MTNNTIIEQFINFNYLERQFGNNRNYDLQKKLQRFSIRFRFSKTQCKTTLKFYKFLAVPSPSHGSKCSTFSKQQFQWITFSEMRFLRSVTGYRRIGKKKKKAQILDKN